MTIGHPRRPTRPAAEQGSLEVRHSRRPVPVKAAHRAETQRRRRRQGETVQLRAGRRRQGSKGATDDGGRGYLKEERRWGTRCIFSGDDARGADSQTCKHLQRYCNGMAFNHVPSSVIACMERSMRRGGRANTRTFQPFSKPPTYQQCQHLLIFILSLQTNHHPQLCANDSPFHDQNGPKGQRESECGLYSAYDTLQVGMS